MRSYLLALAALLCATPAFAQSGPPGGGPGGRGGPPRGDRGQGGQQQPPQVKPLKRERLDKPVAAMFTAADTNRDGLVTLGELQAIVEARRDARIKIRFERVDTDRNGAISAEEFTSWQRAMGSFASSEQQSAIEIGGPIEETLGPDLGDSHEDHALARLIQPFSAMLIVAANTNYDNGVSRDELLAYERKRFDTLDSDHDGQLTMEELRALDPRRDGRAPGEGPPPPMRR